MIERFRVTREDVSYLSRRAQIFIVETGIMGQRGSGDMTTFRELEAERIENKAAWREDRAGRQLQHLTTELLRTTDPARQNRILKRRENAVQRLKNATDAREKLYTQDES